MAEIRVSFMTFTGIPDALQTALAEFEARRRIRVQVHPISWDTGWEDLVKIALSPEGLAISEVGSTWIPSFVSMNTLYPFADYEIARLGGAQAFVPASWQSGALPDAMGRATMWAIPWTTDTRLIYYRRDLLEKAEVDESTAFQTHEALIHTLQALQESGVTTPLVIHVAPSIPGQIHILASWVWGAGGHFISTDGRRALFAEPEALAGLRSYFDLRRFLSPVARTLDFRQGALVLPRMFQEGEIAITIRFPRFAEAIRNLSAAQEAITNLGVAPVPGVPFVGGTNLVVWQHTKHIREVMEIIRFLTGQRVQTHYLWLINRLPARLSALDVPPFTNDPEYIAVAESLKTGRRFRAPYMWLLVEEKLVAVVSQLWTDIFADPNLNVDQAIAERFGKLAHQLDGILART